MVGGARAFFKDKRFRNSLSHPYDEQSLGRKRVGTSFPCVPTEKSTGRNRKCAEFRREIAAKTVQ